MDTWLIILIIILSLILLSLIFFIIPCMIIGSKIYNKQLVRKDKNMWGRFCSAPDNAEQVLMYKRGEDWYNQNKEYAKDLEITSYDNLHLVGQYFDFGNKKCCIIHQGRTESLIYCYYFAKPYKEAGFNILVIDPRAHGLSDGNQSSVGLKEHKDLLQWTKYMHDLGNESIFYHGICIGSATSLYAMTDKKSPSYISGIVVDGMYKNFYSTMATHMKYEGAPMSSILAFFTLLALFFHTGKNPFTLTPKKRIKKLNKPILMIHSKQDIFSLPKYIEELYNDCKSKKKLVWFEKGAHSHVRINNEEEYDSCIKEFLKENNL